MSAVQLLQGYAANAAVLALIAGMLRWMFARIDRYQDRMEKRLKAVEAEIETCHRHSGALHSAYQLTAGALRRRDPHAPELEVADRMLARAFELRPATDEMEALADRIK